MVFEAVAVELLNKFLKQYVENLDTSQLKIGIWGGDVVLKDLKIKTTLLDDLNIPIRVKWGILGKLHLKIPWKNLYASQALFSIEDLLMVCVPNSESMYDPSKEEKWEFERKQAKLRAIEEARKRENEGDEIKQGDSFIEKLCTQITKNLQVTIRNIHIRYEDKTTIPDSPFSFGITISNLSAQTISDADKTEFSLFMQNKENFICKVVDLEGLSVYFNPASEVFSEFPSAEIIQILLESIPTVTSKPDDYLYMFGPMSASAFLRINPKPELDGSNFTIPKIFVTVQLKEIDLAITHLQFQNIIYFLQDYQRILTAAKYRKFRPINKSVIGHAQIWWHFAYNAILVDMRRRKVEMTWNYIKAHRKMCKRYSVLFKQKLNARKPNLDVEKELTELEKKLNVFNLILIREQVYVAVERSKKNKSDDKTSGGGWFFGWFGQSSYTKVDRVEDEFVRKIEKVMTGDEKGKLYKAIGYEESAPPTKFPKSFVEFQFWFQLNEIKLTVYDDSKKSLEPIMSAIISTVKTELEQRSGSAMKVVMMIGSFEVLGKSEKSGGKIPKLVSASIEDDESLIDSVFETKPLDASCDQRIRISAKPLRIVYHAYTINLLRGVFDSGSAKDVNKIVSATSTSLPTFQKITALGLEYAIVKRTVVDVKVDIMSSCIIIPYKGVYDPNKEMLVIMLGKLAIESEEESQKNINIRKMYLEGTTEQEIFSTVLSASYTNFTCQLTGVQVLFQLSGENWVDASMVQGSSPLRFLESTNLVVTLKKSLVTDDARIPKIVMEGKLPSITLNFSEERFISLAALLSSIPVQGDAPSHLNKKEISNSTWSMQSFGNQLENTLVNIQKDISSPKPAAYVQGIDFVGNFEMNEFVMNVSKTKKSASVSSKKKEVKEDKFLTLQIIKLEVELTCKTFERISLLKLGGIEFKQHYKKNILPFVSTKGLENDYYLFVVEYINLDTKVPDFYTTRGGIINRMTLNITPLNMLLNKEGLVEQIAFINNIRERLAAVKQNVDSFAFKMADAGKLKDTIPEENQESVIIEKKVIAKGKKFRKKFTKKDVIDFFLEATLDEIDVCVEQEGHGIAEFCIRKGSVQISSKKIYTSVDFKLKEVFLLDLNPNTLYKKILTSLEEQTIYSKLTMYQAENYGNDKVADMSIEAEVGGIRFTFVNAFFSRAFDFLNSFQSQVRTFKEGATVAAQKAKENVMKAYQNATQICMNIKMTAPFLIIPKNSSSSEVLVADLGVLTVKNSILQLDYTVDSGEKCKPLIDAIKFQLQNLKIGRSVILPDSELLEVEKTFLIPVSFEVNIKRNLSLSWFKAIPEIEILARLGAVHITLTHEDLNKIATVMQLNLNEAPQKKSTKEKITKEESLSSFKTSAETLRDQEHQVQVHENQGSSNLFIIVKLSFFMESFTFDAIQEHKSVGGQVTANAGLARFVLETICVKGKMYSDHSVNMTLMLISCVLDDTRPGEVGRLTRLMERTVDPNAFEVENSIKSMIEISLQMNEKDTFIDSKIYKFTLILSMEFLQKVFEFFKIDGEKPPIAEVAGTEKVTGSEKAVGTEVAEKKSVSGKLLKPKYEMENSRPATFTINFRIEKPDIIIVENIDSIETEALIFHTEFLFKYRVAGIRKVVSGTVGDMELYSCCFNPAKRRQTLRQVVKPFTISIAGSTPQDLGLHVDVCFSELSVVINPSTVELISKCHGALMIDPVARKKEFEEENYLNMWRVQGYQPDSFSFLKTEEGIDVANCPLPSMSSVISMDKGPTIYEICLVAIPAIRVSLEKQSSNRRKPLLLFDMGFQMEAQNWSSKFSINACLSLHLTYYNTLITSWEPLIEPVERIKEDKKNFYEPWELCCSILFGGEEGDFENLQPPKISATLSCSDLMQITFTKTCVEVLKNVVDTFTSAAMKHEIKTEPDLPPFIIKNETGVSIELLLGESNLQLYRGANDYNVIKLETNSEVELQIKPFNDSKVQKSLSISNLRRETKLRMKFSNVKKHVLTLPLGVTRKRYYQILLNKDTKWELILDVISQDVTTLAVLRSKLQILNYFQHPINIHVLSHDHKEAEYIGTVEGNSAFNVPFRVVYGTKEKLFFSVSGYTVSIAPFLWKNIKEHLAVSQLLQCISKCPEVNDPFFIQAFGECEQIYYGNSNRRNMHSVCYQIFLQPTLKIFNSLPIDLVICFQGSIEEKILHPGNNLQITNAQPGVSTVTIRIPNYLEREWSCKEIIAQDPQEFMVWNFSSYDGLAAETLSLGVHITHKKQTVIYTMYCPYFMVNKTQHLLSYRFEGCPSVFYHPPDYQDPVMFSPSMKKFFSKKSAFLQVEQSVWSEKFPVDVAGSGGTVECFDTSSNKVFKISVTITLSYNSLTRIIVFTPYYVLVNLTTFPIEWKETEIQNRTWYALPPGSCSPFWPESEGKSQSLTIKPEGTYSVSSPFGYKNTDCFLLKLQHKCGGVFVNIQATQSGIYITFSGYEPGLAPALIVNHSDKTVTLVEDETNNKITLPPYKKVMHAWVKPMGSRKLMYTTHKQRKEYLNIEEDSGGTYHISNQESVSYLSFLDGTQRVLLFSSDTALTNSIYQSKDAASGIEIICKVHGIGVSLVDNINRIEIIYLVFKSSGIAWEWKKSNKSRYKTIKPEEGAKIEDAYEKYLNEVEMKDNARYVVDVTDKLRVDFKKMIVVQPYPRNLRRTFEPGVWIGYRKIENKIFLHVKINRIQIDNQLHECIFPVILCPVPPPKTVANIHKGPKPFFELSIIKVAADRSGVEQYKYFKILVQEFDVKFDVGFIQQLWMFFTAQQMSDEDHKMFFTKDFEFMAKPLMNHIEIVSSSEQKNFYDTLHFSPLKIHFSFSLAGKLDIGMLPPSLGVMLQSLGVTLTDVHDVIFRLSFFDRKNVFLTKTQLKNEVVSHYYGQTVRQAYVLLLGLDVIGNPYGLIVGIKEGVEAFFYEPFQGIIQGPADFAAGVAIGCKSLFERTVGSTAGTLGKLTETLGKGLAVLSLDKEYQLQRMEDQHRSDNIQASMARGGRGLVMGVFEGVAGVVKKPLEGAKVEGVGGFFKGVGKGMMGLVTRPVTGVVDFASTSLNVVKRATGAPVENRRTRPPRFFRDDRLVEPYNTLDAQGNAIFYAICKKKYCATDKYEFYTQLQGKEYLVLTNRRLILAELSDIFETWQEHMAITWNSMPEKPRMHSKGVAIAMPEKKVSGRKDKPDSKVLLVEDELLREEIFRKMVDLYKQEREDLELMKEKFK